MTPPPTPTLQAAVVRLESVLRCFLDKNLVEPRRPTLLSLDELAEHIAVAQTAVEAARATLYKKQTDKAARRLAR